MLNFKDNNKVKIEGVLSEVDLKPVTFNKNGKMNNAISGTIKVRVEQKLNKTDDKAAILEVPVQLFAAELKNDGTPNPAFENVSKVMNDFTSIAASDEATADRVRITGANIRMNEYYSQTGAFVSFPRISASFVSKIKKEDCKPEATFAVTFAVGNKGYETDSEGVETDKYCITGILPQYGGKVDVVKFYPTNKNVIEAIDSYWSEGDTVSANGRLNFSSVTQTIMKEVDFGEPVEETRTVSVSELLITGGSSTPLEGEFAYDADEIAAALKERKARLAEMKESAKNKEAKKAPAQKTSGAKFNDLGF